MILRVPLLLCVLLPGATAAQQPEPEDPRAWDAPPIAGTWDPVRSLGQPSRLKLFARLAYGIDRTGSGNETGPSGAVGVYRDLFNPVYGALGVSVQGYLGQRGEAFDGGLQAHLESPATFLHVGLDWNARLERVDPTLGLTMPLRRGGWPLPGGQLRVDWIPTGADRWMVGLSVPLRSPLAGRTRSRTVDVELPAPRDVPPPPGPAPGSPLEPILEELRESIDWLAGLHGFFWLTDFSSLDHERTIEETREALADFRLRLEARASAMPERATYGREAETYHGTLERALGTAAGAGAGAAVERGRPLADQLRRFALEEVVVPYNRTIGQYKQPDRLDGLTARARARFVAWLELTTGLGPSAVEDVIVVADAWFEELEQLRARMSRLKRDSRMQWLPLALVLRLEEHDTQEEIDDLIALALGRPFERGNEIEEIGAPAFQRELRRSIRETETYHVLWVHDYRGRTEEGDADQVGFLQTTEGYLQGLLERVRAYDRTGRLPVYLLLVDQYFYETNDGRLWLDLLERPLDHELALSLREDDLVRTFDMERRVAVLQDSLRAAVAGSRRLQSEARAFGADWIRSVVKVHVSVTNPSDFTFRSRRLLRRPPIGADNMMRDHRKIVIRDVTEADPGAGEVILAGVGVGEQYASPTWDDRGLVLRGPAALEAKARAREVLERHGLTGPLVPAPLRPVPVGRDYLQRIEALERAGATARVLQAHNRTGWDVKDATFLQMLIYDLVPAGTVIYVPDSLWTSYEWMAQLVSAALRGCRIYVVAPGIANAPSADFPVMSTMQELVTRLVLVSQEFDEVIAEAGGELKVGLYTRVAPLDDLPGLITDVDTTFAANPFLRDLFPFSDEAEAAVDRFREPRAAGAPQGNGRRPKMHRKTQLVVSASLLRALSASPATAGFLEEALARMAGTSEVPAGASGAHALRAEMERLVAAGEIEPPILYYLSGSMNKNVRSMALDGEVLAAVAGPWALNAYLDFVLLSGGVSWIERVEDVEALLPSYSWLQRLIARWLYRVM